VPANRWMPHYVRRQAARAVDWPLEPNQKTRSREEALYTVSSQLFSLWGLPSEQDFQSKLKLPRVKRAGNHAKVGSSEYSTGEIEIRMIQRVEVVKAELQR
jgi:hypothetical protein